MSGAGSRSPSVGSLHSGSPRGHPHPHRAQVHQFSLNLASVLNDPKLPRPVDMFTRDWGEGFVPGPAPPSTTLRSASVEDFAASVAKFEELVARLARSARQEREQGEDKLQTAASHAETEAALAAIPSIFFAPDFDLSKRDTYAAVMLPPDPRIHPLTFSKLQQERLSHYLDIIEMHLAMKIAQRSDRFLGALSSHESLRVQVQSTLDHLQLVRTRLAAAQAAISTANLRVLQLSSRRRSTVQVLRVLQAIAEVSQTQSTLQQLLSGGDYVAALDLIDAAQHVLRTELVGVHSLRHLGVQLVEMRRVIEELMDQECATAMMAGVRMLIADRTASLPPITAIDASQFDANLADRLDAPSPFTGAFDSLTSVAPSAAIVEEVESKLASVLLGLARQNRWVFLRKYIDSVAEQLKLTIKQTVVDFFAASNTTMSADKDADARSSWAESMRSLPFRDWMALMQTVYQACLVQAHTANQMHLIIKKIIVEAYPTLAADRLSKSPDSLAPPVPTPPPTSTAPTTATAPLSRSPATPRKSPLDVARPADDADAFESDGDGLADLAQAEALAALSLEDDADFAQLDGKPETSTASDPSPDGSASVSTQAGSVAGASTTGDASKDDRPDGLRAATSDEDLKTMLQASARGVSDLCHQMYVRCAKLLVARTRDGMDSNLPASNFIELFQITQAFMAAGETIAQGSYPELRGALLTQAKRFLDRFHSRQKEKLQLLLSNENWSQVDVPSECQVQVDILFRWTAGRATNGASQRQLFIGSAGFCAVGVLLMYVKMVAEYCKCAQDMPVLAADLYTRLADVLRTFNSQCNRLVLRAEALQVVGLRTITAKHLCLCAQALGIVLALLPALQTRFKDLLPDRMQILLKEFAGIPGDYETHRKQVYMKLVSIMEDVWNRSYKEMTWSKGVSTAGTKAVAKSAAKLYATIRDILSPDELARVFQSIVSFIGQQLGNAVRARDPKDKSFLIGVSADILHLEEVLSPLPLVPVESIRYSLADVPLTLPPLIPKSP
eukprot:m.72626 g.72626  ORF g.72626 m.72626 type:complete len:1016 (+) comp7690_c0_seq1:32-3079(+)